MTDLPESKSKILNEKLNIYVAITDGKIIKKEEYIKQLLMASKIWKKKEKELIKQKKSKKEKASRKWSIFYSICLFRKMELN